MSPIEPQIEIELRMDEAFAAGPGSPEERALVKFLAEHGEYQSLWQEYQTLRKGMTLLEDEAMPAEMIRARVRHAARERLQQTLRPARGWRWILSQPVIAAATILLVVGFGIYSQYLFRETKKPEVKFPVLEKKEPAVPKPVQETAPQDIPAKKMAPPPPPAPEPSFPQVFAPAMDGTGGAGAMRSLQVQAHSPSQRLITQAKAKIAAQDCPGALKLLKEAQKIQDSAEIRELIAQCEKK